MLIFSDLHLREDSADVVLGEVLPGILRALEASGERDVACLGDLYHMRYRVDVRLQNAVRAWLFEVRRRGARVHLLPGNHDQVDLAGRNALEVFEGIPGVFVYNEPRWNEFGFWMPYRRDPEFVRQILEQAFRSKPAPSPAVLFMHHGVRGCWMNNNQQDTEGIESSSLRTWERVLCGHYHKRQEVGNLTYIGSPWQTRSDEANQPKGIAFWNGQTLSFLDMSWGPRFVNVELKEGQADQAAALAQAFKGQNVEVRVRTAAGIDAQAVGATLSAQGIRSVVTPEVVVAEARIQLPEGSSLDQFAAEYVKLSPTSLNKERLMKLFEEIVRS